MKDFICCGCIDQDEVALIEKCGAFDRQADAGLVCLQIPFVYVLRSHVSLRLQALNVKCETKTKDNVFIIAVVSVQYQVVPDRAEDAFYKLSNPEGQISSGVVDVFRSAVPQMTLDEVFENKDSVANSISETLAPMMDNYGYKILNALMIDLAPNAQVKASMNEINANKRLRMAAFEKAEAEKIMLIKRAEALDKAVAYENNLPPSRLLFLPSELGLPFFPHFSQNVPSKLGRTYLS